jgi:hypothetical protein
MQDFVTSFNRSTRQPSGIGEHSTPNSEVESMEIKPSGSQPRELRKMQKWKLGNDLEVSAIGLGCMGMSIAYGPAGDKQEMIAIDMASFRSE